MSVGSPLISIVIPVKNGGAWLNKSMPAIFHQTLISQAEVIVIDSGSTDETFSILSQYPVKLLQIESAAFNHGAVRNMGAQQAQGKYVVMTVQDAEPADKNWLQYLLEGFDDDNVAGVCGQQVVPHERDKNPVDWFRPISPPEKTKYSFTEKAFNSLSPEEKKRVCSWDDVNAMYRRDILLKIPFRKISFAEDAVWAMDALKNSYAIVYNPKARVNHYHLETPEYSFRRNFTLYYHFYKFFGVIPKVKNNEAVNILRNTKLLLLEKEINWRDKWKWLVYNYCQRRALREATDAFNEALAKGEIELDKKHCEISGMPPQAPDPRISYLA